MDTNKNIILIIIALSSACSKKPENSVCLFENDIYQIDTQGFSLTIPVKSDLNGKHHYFLRSSASKKSSDLSNIIYFESGNTTFLSVPGIPKTFILREERCKLGLKNLLNE